MQRMLKFLHATIDRVKKLYVKNHPTCAKQYPISITKTPMGLVLCHRRTAGHDYIYFPWLILKVLWGSWAAGLFSLLDIIQE